MSEPRQPGVRWSEAQDTNTAVTKLLLIEDDIHIPNLFFKPGGFIVNRLVRSQPLDEIDVREALQVYRVIAQQNRRKREIGDPDWQGIAFSLDPAAYGE